MGKLARAVTPPPPPWFRVTRLAGSRARADEMCKWVREQAVGRCWFDETMFGQPGKRKLAPYHQRHFKDDEIGLTFYFCLKRDVTLFVLFWPETPR